MRIKVLFRTMIAALLCAGVAPAAQDVPPSPIAVYRGSGNVDAARLRAAVEPMFDPDPQVPAGETRALLIFHDGVPVAQRYAAGFGPDTKHLSWSVGKTVTALLTGILVSDGRLALDQPAPVAAWQQPGDPRGRITLRQLLTMSSGLEHSERARPLAQADTLRMLVGDGAQDMGAYATSQPLESEPGSEFTYSTATTMILSDMMTDLLTGDTRPQQRRDAMMMFIEQRLARPAGMTSLTPEFDASGTMIGGAMIHMTAPDYARLGELLRRNGNAGGRQVVGRRWIDFMTTPSAQRPGYGGHVWINRDGAEKLLFVGDAPQSLFAAQGLHGQYVIVSPRQRLTIVRLGITTDDEMPALRAHLARLIALFPAE